jgi:hypothetical protein
MPTNLHKVRELLSRSTLSSHDQDSLIVALSLANDSELEPVVALFSENPAWMEKISANYKSKKTADASQDPNLWQKIVREEESQLKELEE